MNKFFKNSGPYFLKDLVEEFNLVAYLNAKPLKQIDNIAITDINTLEDADECCISFFSNKLYLNDFQNTNAKACITAEKYIEFAPKNLIVLAAKNPYAVFAKISSKFYNTIPKSNGKISPHAFIDESALLGKNCEIMASSYIDEGAKLGENVKIFPNCYIGRNVEIGDNSVIHHSVTIQNSVMGKNNIIHPGTRIGQDGFGYAFEDSTHNKVPQIGSVIIGNDVEIGANCTIDRGTIKNTIIADMCKIDNLVQIGHNAVLGFGCIIVSQVGISGSSKIGNFVQMGGQSGIAGHLKIGDGVQVAAQSGIMRDIPPKTTVMGTPAIPITEFFKQIAVLKKLLTKKEKND